MMADTALREALGRELEEPDAGGIVAGVDRPLTNGSQKLALLAQTRARVADMESHVVARAAAAAGVPFVAIRVVSDPSNRAIPLAALAGLTDEGRVNGRAVAGTLLRRPWECNRYADARARRSAGDAPATPRWSPGGAPSSREPLRRASSARRISRSLSCTCRSNMYWAGRALVRSISGIIGPLVLIPRSLTISAAQGFDSECSAAVGS